MVSLGPLKKPLRFLRRQLPPANFITLHYTYFIATCLISAVIFWGSSTTTKVSFTDSLFLTVSAMTLAGLNTVNLSELNTFQQFIMFLLIMLGSAIFVSAFVVHVRRKAFERKFRDVLEQREKRRKQRRGRSTSRKRTFSFNRRSSAHLPDVEDHKIEEDMIKEEINGFDGAAEGGMAHDMGTSPKENRLDRSQTPPARRGGPEMNGISSKTGELLRMASDDEVVQVQPPAQAGNQGITFAQDTRFRPQSNASRRRAPLLTLNGVGARSTASLEPSSGTPIIAAFPSLSREDTAVHPHSTQDINKYLGGSVGGWISRNSQFHGLTEHEREQLGGYEYRAVSLLAWLVPVYFVLWQLLGAIGLAAWVATQRADTARANGLNPWWVGAFNAISAFNNSGMSLLDANMTAYQTGYYMLITMSLLILAGNTCYPIFLRSVIWCMWKIISRFEGEVWAGRTQTLRFLLDHPRRCYTNLFPSQHTWWLLWSVITLNGIDWAAFEILNINNHALDTLPTRYRVIDGLFQAFAVRSGGFYVVAIPTVRISLQVLYVVMMYISVYPVVITMRNSNVYEERSLGIYADDPELETANEQENRPEKQRRGSQGFILSRARTFAGHLVAGGAQSRESNGHFVRQQLRAQLAHDAWWIVLALFLIMIVEGSKFNSNPAVFSVFNFIFEIVSAYGCVGISVGVPWAAYSFSGSWHTLSKLILCAVMIRGRHRGLPVAIDRAVLLPGEQSWAAEEDDGRIRMARTMSRGRGEV